MMQYCNKLIEMTKKTKPNQFHEKNTKICMIPFCIISMVYSIEYHYSLYIAISIPYTAETIEYVNLSALAPLYTQIFFIFFLNTRIKLRNILLRNTFYTQFTLIFIYI